MKLQPNIKTNLNAGQVNFNSYYPTLYHLKISFNRYLRIVHKNKRDF